MIAGNKPTNAISVKRHSGALGSPIDPEPEADVRLRGTEVGKREVNQRGGRLRAFIHQNIRHGAVAMYDAAANALMAEVSQFT